MPDPLPVPTPDPVSPGWHLSDNGRAVLEKLIAALLIIVPLWIQQHNQHAEREAQAERRHAEQLKVSKGIEGKLPPRVYGGSP